MVNNRLQSLQLGEVQTYKGIALVPLVSPVDGAFRYRTLGEALAAAEVAITEISASGSVPELMVVNRGDHPVLLIDGEELAGAKQNRVLNTSILLKETSQTRIPVSCTEQGRWAYASKNFSESGNVMAYKSRSRKARSVHDELEKSGTHHSNQGEVWEGIAELQAKAGSHSPTSAMHDIFKAREEDLRQCDDIFKPVPNQVGILVFIAGQPAGVDLVSLHPAYARLHPKLVRSYTLEGLLDSRKTTVAPETIPDRARQFLDEIGAADEHPFPSVGHGADHRFKGKALAGSVLVHQNEVIHAAFFRLEEASQDECMASLRARRRRFSE